MERRDHTLDHSERQALEEWLILLQEGAPDSRVRADAVHAFRGGDGRIIVPVTVPGAEPSLSLALLMAQKGEHVYKQLGVRLQIAQCPDAEAHPRLHLWDGTSWHAMDWPSPAS